LRSKLFQLVFLLITVLYPLEQMAQGYYLPTVNNNVCKYLQGKVMVYAIFVDTKYTNVWTAHDMESTLDSVQIAMDWIKEQSLRDSVALDIRVKAHSQKKILPIRANFTYKTLGGTAKYIATGNAGYYVGGTMFLDRWADKVSKEATKILIPDTSSMIRNQIKPKGRNEFMLRVRDVYKYDNVALMFFINNYNADEYSLTLHAAHDWTVEYCIISHKSPRDIAHHFLHLFGALDLYYLPYGRRKKMKKMKARACLVAPNEVMAWNKKNIDKLEISNFTRYLIGWKPILDEETRKNFLSGGMADEY
jgi:hypothetical protein